MNKLSLSDYGYNILQIETVAGCNMACSFCPYPLKEDKLSTLDINKIKNLLLEIDPKDPNFKYLTLSQFNEPFLDSRIGEILHYAKDLGFKILFITNGLLLNKKKNVELLKEIAPEMKISLQILDKQFLTETRGLNLEFDKYLDTIVNFCNQVKNSNINISIDIGCNFNSNQIKLLAKKILGLQIGDPSVPDTIKEATSLFSKYINKFEDILNDKNDTIEKSHFNANYLNQDGYKLYNNITLKVKPFSYGRKIQDFFPINNNFACNSKILGILADGNVVPCCLAYDDRLSLGSVHKESLHHILKDNLFIKNLRKKGGEKHELCKKCYGEPTKRGVLTRNIINYISK